MGDVRNAYCRVTDDSTQRELCRYRLIDAGNQNGLIVASINREPGDRWGFHAVGFPCRGRNHLESLEEIKQACEGNKRIGQTEKNDTSAHDTNKGKCSACDEMNRMERTQCNGCKTVRPGSAPAASVVASGGDIQSETHTQKDTPKTSGLLAAIVDRLQARKAAAVTNEEYEVAAKLKTLITQAQSLASEIAELEIQKQRAVL